MVLHHLLTCHHDQFRGSIEKARLVGALPLSRPNSKMVVWSSPNHINCNAYIIPSNDTFDQGYWVNKFRLLALVVLWVARACET
jgi:hypothetical protein